MAEIWMISNVINFAGVFLQEVAQPPPSAPANKNLIMAEVDDIVANVMKKVFSSDNSATKTTASSNSNVSPDHHNRKNGVVNNDVKRKKVINSYEVGSFKRAKLLKPGVGTSLHLVSDSSSLRSPGLDDESSSDDDDDESSVAGQGCYDVGALDNLSNGSIMSSPPKYVLFHLFKTFYHTCALILMLGHSKWHFSNQGVCKV